MASSCDIVVVGAGVVGCAVAYEMARRGASVEMIDDRPVGMGSTQAAAGMLAPFLEAREGGVPLDLATRGLAVFDEFVNQVATDAGVALNYHRTGTFDVAVSADALERLSSVQALVARCGVSSELLDQASARSLEPALSGTVVGGLLIPAQGFIGALELALALAAAARRRGARMVACGRVRSIRRWGDELTVVADHGACSGRTVVVAAGSWAGQIDIEGTRARVPVKPIRGQLLHLGWEGLPLHRVIVGARCYLVPWHDRMVLLGATVEDVGFDERNTVAGVRELLDAACDLIPGASIASVDSLKVGLRPATPDGLPVIGASKVLAHLFYATGHYRAGVLLAPLTAQLVANAVLGGRMDPILAHTAPERFGEL